MIYPLVLDLADDGMPVTVTCRVLGFSTQAFYKWRKAPVSQRDWDDAHLINAARDIHADDPAFGYRFIADELPTRGITAGENRVARLCSQERRQRCYGVVLRPSATQRPRPATLVHSGRTAPGDHDLDRADLPPTPAATRTRHAHPDRVRTAPHTSRNRGLTFHPASQLNSGPFHKEATYPYVFGDPAPANGSATAIG